MSIESLIENSGCQASIAAEAPRGQLPAQTAMGGADRSQGRWLSVADGVPCLLSLPSASIDRARNDARAGAMAGVIYFATDPVPGGLSSRHRITVVRTAPGGDPVALGVYAVAGVVDPNYLGRHFEAQVERIRTP